MKELLSRIGPVQDDERYESCKACQTPGTCSWIFGKESFVDWRSSYFPRKSSKFLWIHGPAGYGKSVICAAVVGSLQQDDALRCVHHFFMSPSKYQEDLTAVLRSWIAQMVTMDDYLLDLALEELRQAPHQAGKSSLWKLFISLINNSSSWTFVLDGIDECQLLDESKKQDTREDRSSFLVNLQRALVGTLNRVLIVSRDEPDIRSHLSPTGAHTDHLAFYEHQILVTDVESDVLAFSRSVVDTKLANKSSAIKDEISEKMAAKCDGMFLWIDLHKRDLRGGKNKRQLQQSIEEMPAGLESIYERNWNDILKLASNDKSRALGILRWATFAARPLTVAEVTEALLILDNGGCETLQLDDLPDCIDNEYIADEISGLCGSLLEVRGTGLNPSPDLMTIHLKHFTVKQYLLTSNAQSQLSDTKDYTPSHSEIQNNHLAIACLSYLRDESVQEDLRTQGGNRPFLDYAVRSWYRHVSTAGERYQELSQIATDFFMSDNSGWNLWRLRFHQLWSLDHPEDELEGQKLPSPIYYAAFFGLEETIGHLHSKEPLSINAVGGIHGTPIKAAYAAGHSKLATRLDGLGADLNMSVGRYGSLLGSASHRGDLQMCRYLLAKGASLLPVDEMNRSPLYSACLSGHANVVKLLIEHNADLMAKNCNGWTPINAASRNGHANVVKLLLENKADLSVANIDEWTPLYSACIDGHIDVIKLLLEHNADLSIPNNDRWTPINAASDNGHANVVKLLLEHNADISVANNDGWTPLFSACIGGHIEVVKLLLEHNADISIVNNKGYTPINAASWKGHVETVKLLLEHNAETSTADKEGVTPLCSACINGNIGLIKLLLKCNPDMSVTDRGGKAVNAASRMGHIEVVKLLLEHNADLSIVDKNGYTPINAASWNNNVEVVRLLLEHNVDLSIAGNDGYTPLNTASWKGHVETVKLLLEHNADTSTVGNDGYTPVNIASWQGYVEIARLLIEHNADLSIAGNDGYTPINAASFNGHVEIVKLLLERNAELAYGNALYAASEGGHEKVVQMLLEKGAEINAQGGHYGNALQAASEGGHEKVVQMLLEKGAEINAQGGHYGNALQAASEGGHEKVVQILLKSGAATE